MPRPPTKQPKRRLDKQSQTAEGAGSVTSHAEIVLLAVTGMSPAILTETVWALAQENPPVLPDRIVVLTTTPGKEQIKRELFTPQPHFNDQCGWDCLREKLQERGQDMKGRLRFDPASDLHVLTRWDESSHRKLFLGDIRTADDNEAVADCILEFVRNIVENPDTRLIASIAGGRKTMGTLLYACMTLVGREDDRLTHVLVNEPFDDARLSPRFYFPEQPSAKLTTPDNKTVLAAEAHIDLADVPFVPLRNLFSRELRRMPGRFSALVAQCSEGIRKRSGNSVKLVVHQSRPEIEVNDIRVKLSPKEHLIGLFLADRSRKAQPAFAAYKEAEDSLNEYREQLRREAPENDFSDWRGSNSIASDFDEQEIRKAVSSLRTKLRAAGPDAMALLQYLPETRRLSIDLPRKQQGSQRLQGEVLELEIESLLKQKFFTDEIVPISNGVRGADLLHRVKTASGLACGTIIWETKRTQNWVQSWIAKLKQDQRAQKAEIAALVTQALPCGFRAFEFIDGVWVTDPPSAIGLATALRQGLVSIANSRLAADGKTSKMERLYEYLAGTEFRQKVEAIVEAFVTMKNDLENEQRAFAKIWSRREKQIAQVITSTALMYGGIQGIVGQSTLPEIECLQLPEGDGISSTGE